MLSGRQVPLAEARGRSSRSPAASSGTAGSPSAESPSSPGTARRTRRSSRSRPRGGCGRSAAPRASASTAPSCGSGCSVSPPAGEPVKRRRADRPAEPARIAEARVVGQHQQDVRRALRGGDRRNDSSSPARSPRACASRRPRTADAGSATCCGRASCRSLCYLPFRFACPEGVRESIREQRTRLIAKR